MKIWSLAWYNYTCLDDQKQVLKLKLSLDVDKCEKDNIIVQTG